MKVDFRDPKNFEWLVGVLQTEEKVEVKFTKTDGTERVMNCTLKEGFITPSEKKTEKPKKVNENVLPVFDIDKKEWRSFRLDSILSISFNIF